MSVKCLSPKDKLHIVNDIVFNKKRQVDMADAYGVSRRTIQRVLTEYGFIKSCPSDGTTKTKGFTAEAANEGEMEQQTIDLQVAVDTANDADRRLLDICRNNKITPERLQLLLKTPLLNAQNVIAYLQQLPHQQLLEVAYAVGIHRIAMKYKEDQARFRDPGKAAANG